MDVLNTNFVLIVFLFTFFISFKDSYTLTHTHTHNAGLHPFGNPMCNGSAMAFCDSEDLIYQAEDEGE